MLLLCDEARVLLQRGHIHRDLRHRRRLIRHLLLGSLKLLQRFFAHLIRHRSGMRLLFLMHFLLLLRKAVGRTAL